MNFIKGMAPPIVPQPARGYSRAELGTSDHALETGPKVAFGEHVQQFVSDINNQQISASQATEAFANGTSQDIHGTMIAVEHANVSLHLLGSVRNKALEAYREIMRMGA